MAKKKATVQQTAAKRVLDVLHRKEAYSESTAVGYEAFKNISYPTQVIAYTIANLMENGVVKRTQDERFYFDEQNWNQLKKKVNVGYLVLFQKSLAFTDYEKRLLHVVFIRLLSNLFLFEKPFPK